jgi:hypothetical protein
MFRQFHCNQPESRFYVKMRQNFTVLKYSQTYKNWHNFVIYTYYILSLKDSTVSCEHLTKHSFFLNPFLLYLYGVDVVFFYHFTDGRTPWTSDQLVARPLSKHRTTQTQNKHIHTPNIHVLCWIGIQDPVFRAREDSACLRPLDYRDRPYFVLFTNIIK